MGLTIENSLSGLAVFLQGIFSFLSPCVLPLLPIYMGYLSGGARVVDADGTVHYPRKKVLINTLFFVVGISFAFFALGLGFTAAGQFFKGNRILLARLGGMLVVLFGLFQLGVFGRGGMLDRDARLPVRLGNLAMNPLTALLLGFTFSFAWTPCVGPALASVLVVASSAASPFTGWLLIGLYSLGFSLPFLVVGLFTGQLLALFKKHQNIVNYTVKAGGVLMILMGIMMFTGWMNNITGYLSSFGAANGQPASSQPAVSQSAAPQPDGTAPSSQPAAGSAPAPDSKPPMPAVDFTMTDQFGTEHSLADYKGKVIFLNFWTTWCTYCVKEMPEIEELYTEYGLNAEDVIILGVANPKGATGVQSADNATEEEIAQFLVDKGITYPTLMDREGSLFSAYGISSFPTTFMIDSNGNIFGYVPGQISKAIMQDIIKQTQDSIK